MLNLHRVLFCVGMDSDDIVHVDCLFISILFSHWLFTTFGIVYHVNIALSKNQNNLHL